MTVGWQVEEQERIQERNTVILKDSNCAYGKSCDANGPQEKYSAIEYFNKAVEFQPDLVDAYANLSAAFRKQGNLNRSLAAADRALQLEPDRLEALNAQGNAYMSLGKYEAALESFGLAMAIHPDRPEIYFNLGQVHERRKDHQSAILAYEAFLQHWSGGDVPYLRVARQRIELLKQANHTLN